jgi:adenosylcobinamide-GDP ribazoletransferase
VRSRVNGLSIGIIGGAKHQIRLFFIALQFFTRLPVPKWVGYEEQWLQQAMRFFPLIGWVVAAFAGAVFWVGSLALPSTIAVLLSVASGILLTGALHEDGFADVCDGFGGGRSAARVLDIMKDSRIGAYGAIGIMLLLALKCMALASLPTHFIPAALLLSHTSSRLFATALIWRLDYVRVEGKVKVLQKRISGAEFFIATCAAIIPVVVLMQLDLISWEKMLAGFALASLAIACLVHLFLRRIGGYTGDCLGAVQQVSEVGFYLGFLAC